MIEQIPADQRDRRSQLGLPQDDWHWTELPPMPPELRQGLCATGEHDPDLWSSRDPPDRVQALTVCASCPVREPCAEWSLSLLVGPGNRAIWGGLSHTARVRLKEQRERDPSAPLPPVTVRGMAGQTHCGTCGRPLDGDNLILVSRPHRSNPYRACRSCRQARDRKRWPRRRERSQADSALP